MMQIMNGLMPAPPQAFTKDAAKRALHAENIDSLDDMQQATRATNWLMQHSADPDINAPFEKADLVVFEWDDSGTWTPFEDVLQRHFNQRLQTREAVGFTRRSQRYRIEWRGEEIVQINEATGDERQVRTVSASDAEDTGKNAFEVDQADVKPAALATIRHVLASADPKQCTDALTTVKTKLGDQIFGPSAGELVASLFVLCWPAKDEMDFRFAVGLLIELARAPAWALELQGFVQHALKECAAQVESDSISLRCKLALLLNGGYAEILRLGADVRTQDGEQARVIRFKPGEAKASVCMAESSVVKEVESDSMAPFCSLLLDPMLLEPMLPIARHLISKVGTDTDDAELVYASVLALRAITEHLAFAPNTAATLLLSANIVPELTSIALRLETEVSSGESKVAHELRLVLPDELEAGTRVSRCSPFSA